MNAYACARARVCVCVCVRACVCVCGGGQIRSAVMVLCQIFFRPFNLCSCAILINLWNKRCSFFHKMSIELWVVILDVFHDKNRIKPTKWGMCEHECVFCMSACMNLDVHFKVNMKRHSQPI